MGEAARTLPDERPVLTVAQFAARYGYTAQAVYNMIQRGELGCHRRPGASIRILPRHVDEWEALFDCPASQQKNQAPSLSASQAGGPGTSGGLPQVLDGRRSRAQAAKMRRKHASTSQTSRPA